MATIREVLGAAIGGGADSAVAIQTVESHRRVLARSLLTSTESDEALAARLVAVTPLATNGIPWDPVAEDYALAEAILEQWDRDPAPAPNVLMAAMALAPPHHFPGPPRLADVPPWLRIGYINYLFARPRLFVRAGEADRYVLHSSRAIAAVCGAIFEDRLPNSLDIARSASRADSGMIYFNEQSLIAYFRDKARVTEWMLLETNHQLGHGFPLTKRERPRIGILLRSLSPGTETYHLLGHIVGRDKSIAETRVYLLETSQSHLAETFGAWADEVIQLRGDVSDAVAQMRADDLDLCLIANNVGWGLTVESSVAAHRLARVQVVSGASPCTAGFSSSDFFLTSSTNDPRSDAQEDYVEKLAFVPGAVGAFGFAFDPDPKTIECSRALLGTREDEVVFFSGANCYKLMPELMTVWAEILARVPNSRLVVMPFNPNWGSEFPIALFLRSVHRELIRLGVPINRVRPIAQVPTRADLHAVMSLADIYLDSFPYSGACSLIDPLMVGLPVVGRAGMRLRAAQGASLLKAEGLGSAACPDTESYIQRAVRLASDPVYRAEEADRTRRAAASGLACLNTERFSRRFFAFCTEAILAVHDRTDAQRKVTAKTLRRDIARSAALALRRPTPAFQRLHDTNLVRQLLVPWLKTLAAEGAAANRVIDVGACMGTLSEPFLAAGFCVEMFEPDPDCAVRLAELAQEYVGSAVHRVMAVSTEAGATAIFNKRAVGLSGLGESPYGAGTPIEVSATTLNAYLAAEPGEVDVIKIDAEGSDLDILHGMDFATASPKIVMVEYGLEFPGQSAATVSQAISDMRTQGYDAVIFEYRRFEGFGVTNWAEELADIAFDVNALGARGDAAGNIIFYRRDDMVFLTCLAQLVETCGPAPTRPAFGRLSGELGTSAVIEAVR